MPAIRQWLRSLTARNDSIIVTRWLFLRLLAIVTFIAFLSFHLQYPGLIGEHGILPLQDQLARAGQPTGIAGYLQVPTLSWIDASNTGIAALTFGGMVLSVLLCIGIVPPLTLFLLFVCYLSLTVDGQVFMSYQWDALLLETVFLSIFIAPRQIRPKQAVTAPAELGVWALRVLLFKLIFMSGISKILSGDPTWRGLTAMTYHYWTQPLPNPVAWIIHQFPAELHVLTTFLVLVLEIVVPLFIFTSRRLRHAAGGLIIALQTGITLTGNYTYFNLLTIVLALLLFDDRRLHSIRTRLISDLPRYITAVMPDSTVEARTAVRMVGVAVTGVILVLSLLAMLSGITVFSAPGPIADVVLVASQLKVVNTYGLFAVMTTERPEIVVQGSNDGEDWQTYDFRYKPDDPTEMPPVVAPHHLRLDWQLWFAALKDDPMQTGWFMRFTYRLLDRPDTVSSLLADNPFPDGPRYIRAIEYRYRFTDWHTFRKTGQWWTRERTGQYLPPTTMRNGRLVAVQP